MLVFALVCLTLAQSEDAPPGGTPAEPPSQEEVLKAAEVEASAPKTPEPEAAEPKLPEPNPEPKSAEPQAAPEPSLLDFPPSGMVPSPDIMPPVGTSSAVEQTPGPSERTSAPGLFDHAVRVYGVLKPTGVYAFHGMESFSQPNESGITAAGNPVLGADVNRGRLTGQIMQSRLGIFINENSKYTGHVEVDFFDSRQPTPFYVTSVRIRFLTIAAALTPKLLFEAGLDNDLHAPLDPYTNNLAGDLYEAGNFGAKRVQAKLVYRPDDYEFAIAAGIGSANNGSTTSPSSDGNVELGRTPTVAMRFATIRKHLTAGVSVLATRITVARDTPDAVTLNAASAAAYFVAQPAEDLDVRFESEVGHNAGNMRTLGLGFGHAVVRNTLGQEIMGAGSVNEAGGFLSARYRLFHGINAFYASVGYAAVLNKNNLQPAYTRDATGGLQVTEAQTGPGLKRNMAARLGYELRPVPMFAWILEGMYYDTVHQLRAEDVGANPHRTAFGIESGFQLTF